MDCSIEKYSVLVNLNAQRNALIREQLELDSIDMHESQMLARLDQIDCVLAVLNSQIADAVSELLEASNG